MKITRPCQSQSMAFLTSSLYAIRCIGKTKMEKSDVFSHFSALAYVRVIGNIQVRKLMCTRLIERRLP